MQQEHLNSSTKSKRKIITWIWTVMYFQSYCTTFCVDMNCVKVLYFPGVLVLQAIVNVHSLTLCPSAHLFHLSTSLLVPPAYTSPPGNHSHLFHSPGFHQLCSCQISLCFCFELSSPLCFISCQIFCHEPNLPSDPYLLSASSETSCFISDPVVYLPSCGF